MLPGPRHGHVADALTQSNFKSGPPAGFLHPHAVALGVRPGSAATSLDHTDKAIGGAAHRPLRSARQDVLGPDGRGWVDPVKVVSQHAIGQLTNGAPSCPEDATAARA